jgi:hypothetical protein
MQLCTLLKQNDETLFEVYIHFTLYVEVFELIICDRLIALVDRWILISCHGKPLRTWTTVMT